MPAMHTNTEILPSSSRTSLSTGVLLMTTAIGHYYYYYYYYYYLLPTTYYHRHKGTVNSKFHRKAAPSLSQ